MSEKIFYPLRPIQRFLIDVHMNKAKSTMMNIGALLKLPSGVDMERLAQAVNETLRAHDIFKCRLEFHPTTSELCQTFDSEPLQIEVKNISDEEFAARIEKLKEPYKIIGNQLYRIYLFQTPTAKYFYTDFYHAIMDGFSCAKLFPRETDLHYRGRYIKNSPKSFARYVLEEAQITDSELSEGKEYWQKILERFDTKKHLPPSDVHDKKFWAKGTFKYTFKNIGEEFFRKTRRNEQIFFLGAAMLTIKNITGANDSIINLIHNGRNTPDEKRMFGQMLEEFPCDWDFTKDISIENFLDELEGKIRTNKKFRKSLDIFYSDGRAEEIANFIFRKDIVSDHIMIGDNTAQIIDMPENKISAAENILQIAVADSERGTYDLILDYDAGRYSESAMKNFAESMDKIISDMKKGC